MTPNQPAPAPVSNFSAYLPISRIFPEEIERLSTYLTKVYVETALAVNNRTIGIYDQGQYVTGNRYFNTGDPTNRLQSFRQVYTLTSIAAGANPIPSNINLDSNTEFVQIYGIADNGINSVPLTPWNMTRTDDSPYLYFDRSGNQIIIFTNTANWASYSAFVVLEYILNN